MFEISASLLPPRRENWLCTEYTDSNVNGRIRQRVPGQATSNATAEKKIKSQHFMPLADSFFRLAQGTGLTLYVITSKSQNLYRLSNFHVNPTRNTCRVSTWSMGILNKNRGSSETKEINMSPLKAFNLWILLA